MFHVPSTSQNIIDRRMENGRTYYAQGELNG